MPDAPSPEYDAHSQSGREAQSAAERRAIADARQGAQNLEQTPEGRMVLELKSRLEGTENFLRTMRGGPGIDVKGNIISLSGLDGGNDNAQAAPATMRIRALKLVGAAFVPVTIQLNAQEVG